MEPLSKGFNDYCKERGTSIQAPFSQAYTSTKILVERMNRTLLERVRCMMLNASLPKSFLGKVVATAAYVINGCQSTAIGL